MDAKMEKRLAELREECLARHRIVAELQHKQAELYGILLRVKGAMQVREEQ